MTDTTEAALDAIYRVVNLGCMDDYDEERNAANTALSTIRAELERLREERAECERQFQAKVQEVLNVMEERDAALAALRWVEDRVDRLTAGNAAHTRGSIIGYLNTLAALSQGTGAPG
jgi:hypothetical protein